METDDDHGAASRPYLLSASAAIPEDEAVARRVADLLSGAKTKGELCRIVAEEVNRYTICDLQVIGGRIHTEMNRLPQPYRDQLRPYITEQLFGGHHQLLTLYRSNRCSSMNEPITDPDTFSRFCGIIPIGCTQWDDTLSRMPIPYTVRHRLFYYLIAAFTMFVLDQPGHPVGMPFPGGFRVEKKNGAFYCLIRDHEKEVPYSLCNYCPALQNLDHLPDSS